VARFEWRNAIWVAETNLKFLKKIMSRRLLA